MITNLTMIVVLRQVEKISCYVSNKLHYKRVKNKEKQNLVLIHLHYNIIVVMITGHQQQHQAVGYSDLKNTE